MRQEIQKVQSDLKKMARGGAASDSDGDDDSKAKKKKRTGPSLLQLEREKYTRGKAAAKGKKTVDEDGGDLDSILAGFRSKLAHTPKAVSSAKEKEKLPDDLYGIGEDDSSGVSDLTGLPALCGGHY